MDQNPYPEIETIALTSKNELPENERIERLSFHLKTGDYFPMLATILGFLQETVQDCQCGMVKELVPIETDAIKDARKDLMYLHQNYRIVPHAGGEIS